MTSKRLRKLALTQSALASLNEIEQYSIQNWGKKVTERYLDDLEAALVRIQEHPTLLRPQPDFHSEFCFYCVNKHLLVCDLQKASIIVLAVIHASQDIRERLAELNPTLAQEVELLHKKLQTIQLKK